MLSPSEVEVRLNQLLAHLDGDDTKLEAFNLIAQAKDIIMPPTGKGFATYPHIDDDRCPCVECWAADVRIELEQDAM